MNETQDAARDLEEKTKVVAHLTKTLALTRECLDLARAALESIADEGAPAKGLAECREIARRTLERI